MTLAIAKRDTVYRLHSKALADNQITDREFDLIMAEFSQYNVLKEAVRAKLTRNSSQPDVEKIKKDVRSKMEAEFRKKKTALAASSNKHFKIHGFICISLKHDCLFPQFFLELYLYPSLFTLTWIDNDVKPMWKSCCF